MSFTGLKSLISSPESCPSTILSLFMGVTGFALDAALLFTNARLACAGEKFALSGSGKSSVGPFSPGQSRAHMYVLLVILFSVKNVREHPTIHLLRFSISSEME